MQDETHNTSLGFLGDDKSSGKLGIGDLAVVAVVTVVTAGHLDNYNSRVGGV